MATTWTATDNIQIGLYASSLVLLLGVVAIIYHVSTQERTRVPKGLRPPPSPPGARLFSGHSHIYDGRVTNNPSESQLVKWAEELGEIYQIRMGTQRWVVLSSPEAVKVSTVWPQAGCKPRLMEFPRKSLIDKVL